MTDNSQIIVIDGYCQACNRPIIYCDHANEYHQQYMARIARGLDSARNPRGGVFVGASQKSWYEFMAEV